MDVSEVVRENKTNMTSEEQVKAIIRATRELEEKRTVIYEQLMGGTGAERNSFDQF